MEKFAWAVVSGLITFFSKLIVERYKHHFIKLSAHPVFNAYKATLGNIAIFEGKSPLRTHALRDWQTIGLSVQLDYLYYLLTIQRNWDFTELAENKLNELFEVYAYRISNTFNPVIISQFRSVSKLGRDWMALKVRKILKSKHSNHTKIYQIYEFMLEYLLIVPSMVNEQNNVNGEFIRLFISYQGYYDFAKHQKPVEGGIDTKRGLGFNRGRLLLNRTSNLSVPNRNITNGQDRNSQNIL